MQKARSIQQQFNCLKTIGKGNFGEVKLVQYKKNHKKYAMKTISNINPFIIEQIQRQVKIMKNIQSRYTLCIIDDFYDDFQNQFCIVTDYYQKGDLQGFISRKQIQKSDFSLLNLIFQIRQAFIQLNQKNIIHRDLKPANILISQQGQYRVCDFGCSKFIQNDSSKYLNFSKPFGTLLYNSPEIYQATDTQSIYNKTVDVWSFGIILYQILYQRFPAKVINGYYVTTQIQQIFNKKKQIQFQKIDNISSNIINLLKKMLQIDKNKRIKWQAMIEYTENVITNINQLFNHIIWQIKIIQYMIDLLNKPDSIQFLLNLKIPKKKLFTFVNCLIMLQYDQLEVIQQMLVKCLKPKKYLILPHVYDQFLTKQNSIQFYQKKDRNKIFRKIIPEKFAVQRIQGQVQELAIQLYKTLKSIKFLSKTDNYRISFGIQKFQNYRNQFMVKNTNYTQKFYVKLTQ